MSILLWIALIVILIWLFGWILLPAVGFIIHVLLVVGIIILIVWLITGRRPYSAVQTLTNTFFSSHKIPCLAI